LLSAVKRSNKHFCREEIKNSLKPKIETMSVRQYWRLASILADAGEVNKLTDYDDVQMLAMTQKIAQHFKNFKVVPADDLLEFYYQPWKTQVKLVSPCPATDIVLLYDGSFAPVHKGHVSAVQAAITYIQEYLNRECPETQGIQDMAGDRKTEGYKRERDRRRVVCNSSFSRSTHYRSSNYMRSPIQSPN
jgi:hypothetical protein